MSCSLTNCCVESTMRTAYEKGYKVYTLKDCVAATSIEANDATLEHKYVNNASFGRRIAPLGMLAVTLTSHTFYQQLWHVLGSHNQ